MGSKIRVLSEKVANMIAAGEVVERPASAVKELVENSIDSAAGRVTVEVIKGGIESISVSDDGCGMGRDDALLAFERHATSKLKDASDLDKILTLGFRGEALPSIASVSRLELTTKEKNSLAGTHIRIDGGIIKDVQDIGCPPGTLMVVRDLFFNLPARKKYLKTVSTEMGHITEALSQRANANKGIHFQLSHNGRKVLELPPTDDLRERIAGTLGWEVAKEMLEVEYHGEMLTKDISTPCRVFGYIAPPTTTRPTASQIITYVNGRHIKNRTLHRAVVDAYRTILTTGRYPIIVIFIEIDPSLIDVNVHPTKIEVKFLRENDVYSLIGRVIRNSLTSANLTPRFRLGEGAQVAQVANGAAKVDDGRNPSARRGNFSNPEDAIPRDIIPGDIIPGDSQRKAGHYGYTPKGTNSPKAVAVLPLTPDLGSESGKRVSTLAELVYVGQVFDTYIIAQGKDGLFIIDQHTAHERVLYEQLLSQSKNNGRVQTQRLLLPIAIELSPREEGILLDYIGTLREIGFELEEMGKSTYVLKAFPAVLVKTDIKRAIKGVVDDIISSDQVGKLTREQNSIIALTSCRSAVKAGDRMSPEEARSLIGRLDAASMSFTCVHGRPTTISIGLDELEKKFKRR